MLSNGEILQEVVSEVFKLQMAEVVAAIGGGGRVSCSGLSRLTGEGRIIKSHDLVALMLAMEDYMERHGTTIVWPESLGNVLATVCSLADFLWEQQHVQ